MKWQVDKMASGLNGMLMKWQTSICNSRKTVNDINHDLKNVYSKDPGANILDEGATVSHQWHVDEMASRWNGK